MKSKILKSEGMEEEMESIPDRCPVCRKRSFNVLLHIQKKDSCIDKIEPELYAKWKNEAKKRSKKKYQEKFGKVGSIRRLKENTLKSTREMTKSHIYRSEDKPRQNMSTEKEYRTKLRIE